MKLVILFIVLGQLLAFEESSYKKYVCGNLHNDTCSEVNDDTITLKVCDNSKLCDFHPENKSNNCVQFVKNRYPGEYCDYSKECINGACVKNHCFINDTNSCEYNEHCNANYFCNSEKKCSKVAGDGDNCASSKCDVGLVCLTNKNGTKTCVKIGSLSLGNDSSSPAACRTYYVVDGKCAEGPKLLGFNENNRLPTKCKENCTYTIGSNKYITSCVSEKSADATLLCNPGIGDIDASKVMFN